MTQGTVGVITGACRRRRLRGAGMPSPFLLGIQYLCVSIQKLVGLYFKSKIILYILL